MDIVASIQEFESIRGIQVNERRPSITRDVLEDGPIQINNQALIG